MKNNINDFEALLSEFQLRQNEVNRTGRSTKGDAIRRSFLSKRLIELDWKRCMEISDSFGRDNYYYLMPKTLHESPIHFRKLMALNPECIGSTFNKLHEIKSSQLLEKQLQVLLSLLKEGYEVTYPDYWTGLLDLCTNKAQHFLPQFIENWLAMLVKSTQLLPKEKQQKITDFIQKNGDSIDQNTNSQIQNVLVDVEKQISAYEYQLWSNYRKQQNESFSENLKTLSDWLEKMTPEGMEAAYLKDKDNNEILLSYDMEYTNQLYESLGEYSLYLAHQGEDIEFVSDAFHIIQEVDKVIQYSLELIDDNEELQHIYLAEIISGLKDKKMRDYSDLISDIDPYEPEVTNSLLQLISENSDNYYVEGAAGLSSFSCFLTNRRHYKNYLEDIKVFCNSVYRASIKYKDEMLKN